MTAYSTMPSPLSYGTTCFYRLPHLAFPTESLTEGTCLPRPPPPSPRTIERPPRPLRTNTHPLQQHPTTASDLLPSPLSMTSMPGSFPISPLVSPISQSPKRSTTIDYLSGAPYPSHQSPIMKSSPPSSLTTNPPPKRPLSIRNMLSLRNLKRSYNNRSTDSVNTFSSVSRPSTPGTPPSTAGERPVLKKKTSMAFWGRRKSSLSLGMLGVEDVGLYVGEEGKVKDEDRENVVPVVGDGEKRSSSPPPMLPELDIGEGRERMGEGVFMDGVDVFGSLR